MKLSRLSFITATALYIATLVACNNNKVYDRYEHTSTAGWERNDTLQYSVPSIKTEGIYKSSVGLRLTDDYPFTAVTLIVDRHIVGRGILVSDTINCQLTDSHGNAASKGISYHQYKFDIRPIKLQSGDSLQIGIRHYMKCEILPGISDVGITMSR